jgi:hypothetical protein
MTARGRILAKRSHAALRQTRSLEAKLSRIGVLTEDSRAFLKGHRIKPHFPRELDVYLGTLLRLSESVHLTITGGL